MYLPLVASRHSVYKIMIANQRKERKHKNQKISHKYKSKTSFTNGIHSLAS